MNPWRSPVGERQGADEIFQTIKYKSLQKWIYGKSIFLVSDPVKAGVSPDVT